MNGTEIEFFLLEKKEKEGKSKYVVSEAFNQLKNQLNQ